MKSGVYIVTAHIHSGNEQMPESRVWNTSEPLTLGHPFQWIIEQTDNGIRIRSIASALNTVVSQSVKEIPFSQLKGDRPIPLPQPGRSSRSPLWIKLRPAKAARPAFAPNRKVNQQDFQTENLKIYSCIGPWIKDISSFKKEFQAASQSKKFFTLAKNGDEWIIEAATSLIVLPSAKAKKGIPLEAKQRHSLKLQELDGTHIQIGLLNWRFNFVDPPKAIPASARRKASPENILFYRSLGAGSAIGALMLLVLMLIPQKEPEPEEELVPPQYTRIVLNKNKPAAPEPAPAAPAKSSQPVVQAQNTKVVQAFRAKALQSAVSGLLKGGMTQLLAQSDFVSQSRKQGKLFKTPRLAKASALTGMAGGRKVKVASLGGSANGKPGSVGYAKGRKAGVSGQGSSFVALDTGGSQVEKGLTKEEVGRVIHAHMHEIRYCYESSMLRTPDLEGKLLVDFNISPRGRVDTSAVKQSTLADARLDDCILRRLAKWQFPKPKGGVNVAVTYPFIFKSIGR